jgi:hypothetical protein
MTGKVLSVLVHMEVPCARCGRPWRAFGEAAVIDGRIADTAEVDTDRDIICDECQREANREYRKQLAADRKRQQWASGKVPGRSDPKQRDSNVRKPD